MSNKFKVRKKTKSEKKVNEDAQSNKFAAVKKGNKNFGSKSATARTTKSFTTKKK